VRGVPCSIVIDGDYFLRVDGNTSQIPAPHRMLPIPEVTFNEAHSVGLLAASDGSVLCWISLVLVYVVTAADFAFDLLNHAGLMTAR